MPVNGDGVVELAPLDEWLTSATRFVSVMLANNETGVIQPVAEIAARCAAAGVPLHTDAAQMVGKLPVDFRALGATSMTVAPHKFHGPVGIGVLVARHELELHHMLHGGFQQAGLAAGHGVAAAGRGHGCGAVPPGSAKRTNAPRGWAGCAIAWNRGWLSATAAK